jgi:hypothetical protein
MRNLILTTIVAFAAFAGATAHAAVFEDVPYPHWSWAAVYELKRAVGFEVYPDFTPPGPQTRYEMAMQLNSIYEELAKPAKRARLSLSDTKKLFALTADYAPEFCLLNSASNRWIEIRETITWLARNKILNLLSANDTAKHSSYNEIPKGGWVYHAIDSFISSGILEGHLSTEAGHGGSAERTYTRYEIAMVTARIYTKLEYGYYSKLNDAEILRLLALSSEFAPEMDMLGFDCRPPLLALLEGRLFVPLQMNAD